MKMRLFIHSLMLVISIGTTFASNTSVDGIWYNFNTSNLTAEVTYRGSDEGSYANEYSGAVTIPSTVTYSGKTYNVTSIGTLAFHRCNGLTSIEIPNSVTSIGDRAFSESSLTSVSIGNNVISIGRGAFYCCFNLTSIEIPESVTSIGDYAFQCTGVTSVVWNAKNCHDCPSTKENHPFGEEYQRVKSFTFGDQVEYIPAYLCLGMSRLRNITIPNSVTSIGMGAFQSTGMTSVTIPNSVIRIGIEAFYCSSLTSVTIGSGIIRIGYQAFRSCDLTSITCWRTTPPLLEAWAFDYFDIPLYVPAGSITAYKAADQWENFNSILAIPGTEGIDNMVNDEYQKPMKIYHNGQFLILRGDKTYTLQGQAEE